MGGTTQSTRRGWHSFSDRNPASEADLARAAKRKKGKPCACFQLGRRCTKAATYVWEVDGKAYAVCRAHRTCLQKGSNKVERLEPLCAMEPQTAWDWQKSIRSHGKRKRTAEVGRLKEERDEGNQS